MKTNTLLRATTVLGLAAFTAPASAQFPPVTFQETATEFAGRADPDGNGLTDVILVDKTSGSFRVCYQTAAGVFQWDEPKASGIGEVTGVTAGHLLANTQDALAMTAPEANRINLLTPVLGGAIVPQSVFVTPVGPTSLVAANLLGTIAVDDLWIGSSLNSTPFPGRFDQFVNSPAGTLTLNLNRHLSAGQFDSVTSVIMKTGLAGTFAYLEHLPAGETLRILSPGEAGAPVRLAVAGLPPDSSYLIAPFAGATLANLLTWKSGDSTFSSRAISEAVPGIFTVAAPLVFTPPFPAGQLMLVPVTAITSKLLIIAPGGTQAAYFDFNGTTLSAPLETLTPPAGEQFTGGVALPGFAGFHLLRGAAGDGRTNTSRYLKWNAASGRFVDSGGASFEPMGKRSGAGNVMIFAGEPFISPSARLVSRLNARDWSSGTPPVPPATLNLTGEINRTSAQGLGGPVSVNLGPAPAGATHVLLNQFRPFLSFFALSRADGTAIGEPFITPSGGVFSRSIQLSFTAPPGMTVQFRDAGGTWTPFIIAGQQPGSNPGDVDYELWWSSFRPLLRFKDTVIEYYGQTGNKRTPIKTASFKFTDGPDKLSSLGDGVPDYVKLGQHYNPLQPPPNLDPAEQGSFLNRLLPGVGDPRALTASALDLYVRPLSLNGYDNTTRPALLAGTALPDGTLATGNQITAYDAGGAFLAGSDDTQPPAGINPGLRIWPAFAEPSAKLSGLSGEGNGGFTVLGTPQNFAIAGAFPGLPPAPAVPWSSTIGREIVGILPLPGQTAKFYQRNYNAGPDASESAAWIAGATSFYNAAAVPAVTTTLDSMDTMALLVMERWILLRCIGRDLLPGPFTPPLPNAVNPPPLNPNSLTLTAFRASEAAHAIGSNPAGPVYPTAALLHSLEVSPPPVSAYRLPDVIASIQNTLRTSADPDLANLRNVVNDVYLISSRRANESRGGFELPLDALRHFLATGAVPPGYGNKVLIPTGSALPLPGAPYSTLTDGQFTSAIAGMEKVLASVSARPWANFNLIVRTDTVQSSRTLLDQAAGGGPVRLVGPEGTPFKFPSSFKIAPGSHVQVTAYTDRPAAPSGPVVEVVDIAGIPVSAVTSVPVPTPQSGDNLLPDDWELFFFGHTGLDPFASPPGTGLSYLQFYLDGKDPLNPASFAGLQIKLTQLPVPIISAANGGADFLILLDVPAEYASSFTFQLQTSTELGNEAFSPSPEQFHQTQPGHFEVTTPSPSGSRGFWRVGVSLK